MSETEKALVRAYVNLLNSRIEVLNGIGNVIGIQPYDNDNPLYEQPVLELYDIIMNHFVILSEEDQCNLLLALSDYGNDKRISADEIIDFIEERI